MDKLSKNKGMAVERIFQTASDVSTPLALAGLFASIIFFILKQIIAKNIFPELSRVASALIIRQIVDRLFYLALLAMVLGFISYLSTPLLDKISPTVSIEEKINKNIATLSSGGAPSRMIALASLAELPIDSKEQFEVLIRVLVSHISALAPRTETGVQPIVRSEIETTLRVLSNVLKGADSKKIDISRPTIALVDLSETNMEGLYLANISITDSRLSDANISNSVLTGAKLIGILAQRLTARNVDLNAGQLLQVCAEEADFEGANLSKSIITSTDLNNANLSRANLESAKVENSRLASAIFSQANLVNVDLSGALEFHPDQIASNNLEQRTGFVAPPFTVSKLSICKVRI